MPRAEIMRAYRVALDPTRDQVAALTSHAGANRAAYNYHLAAKIAAHRQYAQERAWLTYTEFSAMGPDDALAAAKKAAGTVRFPNFMDSVKAFCADPDKAWHAEVNRYALSSGMRAADTAWKNWVDSITGKRAGRAAGYPRFHAKGRSRDSFTLYHDVKKPTPRPDGYRRLNLPAKVGGSIRLHGNLRRLARRIAKGSAVIASVTISRGGRHWYASILAREIVDLPAKPTAVQQLGGVVGVDLGVHHLSALSTGDIVPNPRHLRRATQRLTKAQRRLARTGWRRDSDGALIHDVKDRTRRTPTRRRVNAQAALARAHADVATARASTIHALTKHLTTTHAVIAIEDLNVAGMTASARGTIDNPGRNVRAKAGLNRSILDAGFGEFRRQLDYKSGWYGASLVVIDRFTPTSKTCSGCGAVKAKLPLSKRTYDCPDCGLSLDRDVNAALNIAAAARAQLTDACGKRESRNARRGTTEPVHAPARTPTTREGQDGARAAPATPARKRAGRPKRAA